MYCVTVTFTPLKASLKPLFKQSENNTQRNTPTKCSNFFSKEQNKREKREI